MYKDYQQHLVKILSEIREAGLYKNERVIVSPQGAEITLDTGQKVLNFCANNYLGLSANKQLVEAAKKALTPMVTACRRFALYAARRPSQGAGAEAGRIFRDRGHHPVCSLFRRQRRGFEPL
jgi:7-keto-8-aminopelargonate synthetase-like enzyme